MLTGITLHLESQRDGISININWWDHNNVLHSKQLQIEAMNDAPREVQVRLEGEVIATLEHTDEAVTSNSKGKDQQ